MLNSLLNSLKYMQFVDVTFFLKRKKCLVHSQRTCTVLEGNSAHHHTTNAICSESYSGIRKVSYDFTVIFLRHASLLQCLLAVFYQSFCVQGDFGTTLVGDRRVDFSVLLQSCGPYNYMKVGVCFTVEMVPYF